MFYPDKHRGIPRGAKVIVHTWGPLGFFVLRALRKRGSSVVAICDIDEAGGEFEGIPIIGEDELRHRFSGYLVVVASDYTGAIRGRLNGMGGVDCLPVLIEESLCLFQNIPEDLERGFTAEKIRRSIDKHIAAYRLIGDRDRLILPSLDIVVTERCALKCGACANLMQYYDDPQDYALDMLISSSEVALSKIDYVSEVILIGGEPFLSPHIQPLIRKLAGNPSVGTIRIITNGTVLPGMDLSLLLYRMAGKIVVSVSNYAAAHMREEFSYLPFVEIIKPRRWTNSGRFLEIRDNDSASLERKYAECCTRHSTTLLGRKLYRCPFSAHAINLGAISDPEKDGISVFFGSKDEIHKHLSSDSYFSSCQWCPGRGPYMRHIPVARQVRKPIKYKKRAGE
jgi:hypothetical protein